MYSVFSHEMLEKTVAEGWITKVKHPNLSLWIYNYSRKCQIERHWNAAIIQCRGLILDKFSNMVARPFSKFFTHEQYQGVCVKSLYSVEYSRLYQEPCVVTEKLDGSLGILYNTNKAGEINGGWAIATRGSFVSNQALEGTKIFYENHQDDYDYKDGITYLFEIIYPENRVVLNYGSERSLRLIACINNNTGFDNLEEFARYEEEGFLVVRRYDFSCLSEAMSAIEYYGMDEYGEGVVVYFPESGFRIKLKTEDYVKLHKQVTNCSSLTIWQSLRDGLGLEELSSYMPDEALPWISEVANNLFEQYDAINQKAQACLNTVLRSKLKRQYIAESFFGNPCLPLIFLLLDNKEDRYREHIWDMIKPRYEKPIYEIRN